MTRPRFHLPDGEVAFYEWGTYSLNLAGSVGQDKDTVPRILNGLNHRIAFWSSDDEFRQGVAILHECVHCLQDLTAGVGLWDFFLRRECGPAILAEWRLGSYLAPFGTQMPSEKRAHYNRWLDGGFVPQSDAAAKRRLSHFKARMSLASDIVVNETSVFAIDRLLEAEAVAQVHLALSSLNMSSDQLRTMFDHESLWSAPDMADLYQGVFIDVIDIVREWSRADQVDLSTTLAKMALLLTAMLIDISLAHPSADYIANSEVELADYDPGLKFLLLLAAFAGMPLAEHDALLTAIGQGKLDEVERRLIARCAIPYPESREIYADWIVQMERLQIDDRRVDLRLHALKTRVEQPAALLFKSPVRFFEHGLPLIVVAAGGFRLTSMNPTYILGNTRLELIADIAREQAVTRLFSSAMDGDPFMCSHAEFGICSAKTNLCTDGISAARQFPIDDQCVVRRMLNENHFGTFKPLFGD